MAKATLYALFGDKEGLVRAYLMGRDEGIRGRMTRRLARYDTPRERLLGVFDVQGLMFGEPGFRGCAFARDAGARDPEELARQLMLLYDGAAVSAWMDHNPSAGQAARSVATALVDAALPGGRRPAKKAERGDAALDGRSPGLKAPPSNRLPVSHKLGGRFCNIGDHEHPEENAQKM